MTADTKKAPRAANAEGFESHTERTQYYHLVGHLSTTDEADFAEHIEIETTIGCPLYNREQEAKARLRDAIRASSVPVHVGVALFASADSYAKAKAERIVADKEKSYVGR